MKTTFKMQTSLRTIEKDDNLKNDEDLRKKEKLKNEDNLNEKTIFSFCLYPVSLGDTLTTAAVRPFFPLLRPFLKLIPSAILGPLAAILDLAGGVRVPPLPLGWYLWIDNWYYDKILS